MILDTQFNLVITHCDSAFPNHSRTSPNHPRSHQKFPKSCIWDKFSLLPRLITFRHRPLLKSGSNSTPNMSTRIQFLVFGLGTSHSKWWIQKSHYSIPTLMQNPTEFTSRVFKKQCFWRKKMAYTHVWNIKLCFFEPPTDTFLCAFCLYCSSIFRRPCWSQFSEFCIGK